MSQTRIHTRTYRPEDLGCVPPSGHSRAEPIQSQFSFWPVPAFASSSSATASRGGSGLPPRSPPQPVPTASAAVFVASAFTFPASVTGPPRDRDISLPRRASAGDPVRGHTWGASCLYSNVAPFARQGSLGSRVPASAAHMDVESDGGSEMGDISCHPLPTPRDE